MSVPRKVIVWKFASIFGLVLVCATSILSQEHPEHPKTSSREKAKETIKDTSVSFISIESLGQAITDYITDDAKLKGGYFVFYDKVAKTPLLLTFVKVHKDKLAKVGDDLYFACSDFKQKDGKLYDLDFFMKSTSSGLQATEIMIHKVNGEPRYKWYEENGVWKRR